jgi:hypothetical protein
VSATAPARGWATLAAVKLATLAIGPFVTLCLAGCAAPFAEITDLKVPGVTCGAGLRFDGAAGCTREIAPGEVPLRVGWRSELGAPYTLVGAMYTVDKQALYGWRETPPAKPGPAVPVLYVSVPPGEHRLMVQFMWRGPGARQYDMFSSNAFTSLPDKVTEVTVVQTVVIETTKGEQTPPTESPGIRWVGTH